MIGTPSDQTDREASVAALLESWKRLDALVSGSFEAIVAIDVEKRIVKFNQQAESLLGYSESELIGQSVLALYEDKVKAGEIYRTIQELGTIDSTEIVLFHKDGRRIPISLSGKHIIDTGGQSLGQVGFMKDMRDIQLLERRLEALIESSKAINSTFDPGKILECVVQSALQAIPAAERGSIHLFDHRSSELKLRVSSLDYSKTAWETSNFQIGEGLAGWVFEYQEPVISGNAAEDHRYKHSDVQPGGRAHRSMLCVPITSKHNRIGVISLSSSTETEAFQAADQELLTGFAGQAAIAIENADQLFSLKKEAQELDFLRDFSLQISRQTNIEEILEAILEGGNSLLGTEMAVVHWRGRDGRRLQTFVAPKSLEGRMTEPRMEEGLGLTAEIFRNGEPVVVPDTSQDTRVNPAVLKAGIQSLVGYPLTLSGQVAGVLFFNSLQRQFFGEHEMKLISQLLPLAAVAIENSDIIEHLERNRRLSEALVQVSSKLAGTQTLEEQMSALKHFMNVELAAPMFYLGLYDEINDSIELKLNCEDCIDLELMSIPLKDLKEWTISSYVVKKQLPIVWYSEQQKQEECRQLGISPVKKGPGCQTCVAFPLEVEEKVLGVISIQSPEAFAWDEIEVSTFQTLAHQASIAIRNARLREQLNKVGDTARKVAELTVLGDLKNTLDSVVNGVKDILGCDIVTLWTYRQDKDQFNPHPTTAGELRAPDELTKTSTVPPRATPFKIIRMDDLYVAHDTQQDPILGSPFAIREHVCSTVAVPLKPRDRRVGVLFINYCHEKHIFTPEELAIIRLFSYQAAVAISNAMLYEDEQKRRDLLKIIDEAGRTVTGSLQLDEIFDNLARQAYEISGERGDIASFATITLVEGNQTVLKAAYPTIEEDNISRARLTEINLQSGIDGRIGIVGRAVKNKAPLLVDNVEKDPDFLRSNPDTKCELAVPILYRGEVVGVINVEHREIGGIDNDDLQNTQSLAAHAAVAIQNARMYEALERKNRHQQAIYEASKIINSSLDLTEKELLDILVKEMVTKIAPLAGAMNILGAVNLYDEEQKELRLEGIYPASAYGTHRMGETRSLRIPSSERIGIGGRAVLRKEAQRVDDVSQDDDYLIYSPDTRSELDVPIMDGRSVLGALSLECDRLSGFDEDAEAALSSFAELAAIAIRNTRSYQALKEARAMVGNMTAVAWMGVVSGAWRHAIGNMVTTISDISRLAQKDLEKGKKPEQINPRLELIREITEEVQKIPMPPLSSEAGVEPIYICQLVRDRINQFKSKKQRYEGIEFDMAFEVDELSSVRASPEWLRRVLDILIDNARNAMKGRQRKEIHTVIAARDEGVEILISDTGTGIPLQLQRTLFKKPVEKAKDEKGSGIGLFLANTIIQTYNGRLEIRASGPDGTTMALWLPLMK